MTSEACRRVLVHFGYRAKVIPCQLVGSTPSLDYTVGFIGDSRPGKWDGHVVCATDDWLFDGALAHVSRGLELQLPACVAVQRTADRNGGVIAEYEIPDVAVTLRWRPVPLGYTASVPRQPKWVIKPLAARLITRVGMLLKSSEREICAN